MIILSAIYNCESSHYMRALSSNILICVFDMMDQMLIAITQLVSGCVTCCCCLPCWG